MDLALFVIGTGLVAGIISYIVGHRGMVPRGVNPRSITGVSIGIVVLFSIVGIVAGLLDADMRATTLAEAILPGTLNTPAPASRTFDFAVEHPGVEHTLFVSPRGDSGVTPSFPATLGIRLAAPDGAVISDVSHVYTPEGDMDEEPDWPGLEIPFTPNAAGRYSVTVTVGTPKVPSVHIHVKDPEKTDGTRLPGY